MTCRLVAITPFAVTKKPEPVAVGKPGVDRRMNTTLLRTSAGWKGAPSAGSAAASLSPTGGWAREPRRPRPEPAPRRRKNAATAATPRGRRRRRAIPGSQPPRRDRRSGGRETCAALEPERFAEPLLGRVAPGSAAPAARAALAGRRTARRCSRRGRFPGISGSARPCREARRAPRRSWRTWGSEDGRTSFNGSWRGRAWCDQWSAEDRALLHRPLARSRKSP